MGKIWLRGFRDGKVFNHLLYTDTLHFIFFIIPSDSQQNLSPPELQPLKGMKTVARQNTAEMFSPNSQVEFYS